MKVNKQMLLNARAVEYGLARQILWTVGVCARREQKGYGVEWFVAFPGYVGDETTLYASSTATKLFEGNKVKMYVDEGTNVTVLKLHDGEFRVGNIEPWQEAVGAHELLRAVARHAVVGFEERMLRAGIDDSASAQAVRSWIIEALAGKLVGRTDRGGLHIVD